MNKNDENNEKFDKVINELIKTHKIFIRKRYNLIEYEEKNLSTQKLEGYFYNEKYIPE